MSRCSVFALPYSFALRRHPATRVQRIGATMSKTPRTTVSVYDMPGDMLVNCHSDNPDNVWMWLYCPGYDLTLYFQDRPAMRAFLTTLATKACEHVAAMTNADLAQTPTPDDERKPDSAED